MGGVSQFVPTCPVLSPFVLFCPRSGPQEGRKRTNGDKTGHFGTNWETPPFSSYPHLALLRKRGGLAKGVSAESSVTPKETKKIPGALGPAVHLALTASWPREAHAFAKTPF